MASYFRSLYWLCLPLLAVGCKDGARRYPRLEEYVKRNKVCVKVKKDSNWQETAHNFSEVYGPKFTKEENDEFLDWRVK